MLDDTSSEVRLAVVKNINGLVNSKNIGSLKATMLPNITKLAQDNNWRVREGVVRALPKIVKVLDKKSWDDDLSSLVTAWLGDSVYSIREAAVDVICELTGESWKNSAINCVLPKIIEERDK